MSALAYQKDLGKWFGRHQASVFRQDMESWVNQMTMRFYETDGSGAIIQNLSNITNGKGADIPLRDGDVITIPESLF